jgi:uncharacterized RDD family membrane protein YckC
MYCSKCGSTIPENAGFCTACGQQVFPTAVAPIARSYSPVSAAPRIPTLPYAGFWLRVVAHLIDSILGAIVFSILLLLGFALVGIGHLRNLVQGIDNPDEFFTPEIIAIALVLDAISIVTMWIYYAWMESSPNQGTLGKVALGLIVTDLEGRPITFARASARYFSKIITGLIPFGIGYMMAGFTEKKQALHDIIADCLVLRKL